MGLFVASIIFLKLIDNTPVFSIEISEHSFFGDSRWSVFNINMVCLNLNECEDGPYL